LEVGIEGCVGFLGATLGRGFGGKSLLLNMIISKVHGLIRVMLWIIIRRMVGE
jgi:hypothetical protein